MIKIVLFVGLLAILGNFVVLDYFVFKQAPATKVLTTQILVTPTLAPVEITKDNSEKCGSDCLAAINAAVDEKVAKIKIPQLVSKPVPTAVGTKTREWIIPLGPGTVEVINTWFDAYTAQTTINTSDYPPIQQAYFEVVMHIPNTTGQMSARLYDTSTPYIFAGQVLNTTSGTGQMLSAPFPIQSGSKNYHVQLYSTISQGVLDSSKIRLVTN